MTFVNLFFKKGIVKYHHANYSHIYIIINKKLNVCNIINPYEILFSVFEKIVEKCPVDKYL